MPDPFDLAPHVMCCRFSLTISLSTSSLVRLLTFFGARLLSSNPFIPPTAYLNSHLCPVLRVIPNSSHSSLTVNRPLCAKLINRCFCSIGNSFFQGILPSLCVTHVLGQFVTDLLGSHQFVTKKRRGIGHIGQIVVPILSTALGCLFAQIFEGRHHCQFFPSGHSQKLLDGESLPLGQILDTRFHALRELDANCAHGWF